MVASIQKEIENIWFIEVITYFTGIGMAFCRLRVNEIEMKILLQYGDGARFSHPFRTVLGIYFPIVVECTHAKHPNAAFNFQFSFQLFFSFEFESNPFRFFNNTMKLLWKELKKLTRFPCEWMFTFMFFLLK